MPQFISDKPSSVACCHVENQPHPTGIDPSQPAQPAGTLKLEGLSTRKDSIALVDAAPPAPRTKDDGHAAHVECVGCFPEKERCAGSFKGTRKFNIQVVFTLYCFKLKRSMADVFRRNFCRTGSVGAIAFARSRSKPNKSKFVPTGTRGRQEVNFTSRKFSGKSILHQNL